LALVGVWKREICEMATNTVDSLIKIFITGALRSRVSSEVGGAVKSKLLIVTPHEVEPSLGVLRHELHL
jgi:hypothetical protein